MKKVLIPTRLQAIARERLEAHQGYEVIQDPDTPPLELLRAHPDAHALIVRSEKVDAACIDAGKGLRLVIRAGAGYNTIDTAHARRRGIDVMNTPGANANAVAEEVLAMILADARHVVAADPSVRAGEWKKNDFMGRELSGKTLGIVGLGAIGRMLVKRLSGFEVTLLGYDPVISVDRAEELGVRLTKLRELFRQSDIISLHVPENEETLGMVDTELLQAMKTGATLVNCARSGLVAEEALRTAVRERGLRYLVDVYPQDAPGPKSVADCAALLMPHLGASTVEANSNAARQAAEQLLAYDDKGITACIVNRDVPEGLDALYGDLAYTLTRFCRHVVGFKTPLKLIETSFYGELQPYADWLVLSVVAAVSEGEIDRGMDARAARAFLHDKGIDFQDRETDAGKGFKNSMTIDLTGSLGADRLRHASVRGTIAEGSLMISRINNFEKLYFEPRGHTVLFTYRDRPGVLGQIGAALAAAGVNIDDVRNPHDLQGKHSLALLRVSRAVPREVIERVRSQIAADIAFYAGL